MKACSKCGAVKALTEFRRNRARKDGHSGECKACALRRDQEWYQKNKDHARAYRRRWYLDHREEMIQNSRDWYYNNPLLVRARDRVYYAQNAEEIKAKQRAWYAANIERAAAYHKAYRASHPEKVEARRKRWRAANIERARAYARLSEHRRRARKNASVCDFTEAQWVELVERYGFRCAYCGGRFEKLTQDHVIPIALGGAHTLANIVPACSRCNKRKWIKTDWVPMDVSA